MPKPHYTVVAAVITQNQNGAEKIFCAQRPGPKPGKDLRRVWCKTPCGRFYHNPKSRVQDFFHYDARFLLHTFGRRTGTERTP